MDRFKCSCGHVNPPGTTICESCGKPLEDTQELLNMRYDGVSRRSQITSRSFLDYIWKFFSSVKIAVWMIAIALIASIIGTILPQEQFKQSSLPAEQFYPQTYGWIGEIYYRLGFHQLFYSWWYILLLLMIGISLVVCSLDRVIPLYKALHRQRLPKHLDFFRRQRLFWEKEMAENPLSSLEMQLKKRGYSIKREGDRFLAEKGRISRWGPYINHVGLILIILSVMLRFIPGFYLDEYIWVWDGETKKVPGTPYYIENKDFKVEYYQENEFPERIQTRGPVVKNYETDAVLYAGESGNLKPVKEGKIRVNEPMAYQDLYLYQSGNQVQQMYGIKLDLIDKTTKEKKGEIELSLFDPKTEFTLGEDITIKVLEYYPDFALNEEGKPYTKSAAPNRPAYVVEVNDPAHSIQEKSWVIAGMNGDELTPQNRYRFQLTDFVMKDRTGLMVRIDKGLPALYASTAIVMIGLIMGFYWQHRRIWVLYRDKHLYIAAHTNKNWYGLKRELAKTATSVNLPFTIEEFEQGVRKKNGMDDSN